MNEVSAVVCLHKKMPRIHFSGFNRQLVSIILYTNVIFKLKRNTSVSCQCSQPVFVCPRGNVFTHEPLERGRSGGGVELRARMVHYPLKSSTLSRLRRYLETWGHRHLRDRLVTISGTDLSHHTPTPFGIFPLDQRHRNTRGIASALPALMD